jgi:hypothetical protein
MFAAKKQKRGVQIFIDITFLAQWLITQNIELVQKPVPRYTSLRREGD